MIILLLHRLCTEVYKIRLINVINRVIKLQIILCIVIIQERDFLKMLFSKLMDKFLINIMNILKYLIDSSKQRTMLLMDIINLLVIRVIKICMVLQHPTDSDMVNKWKTVFRHPSHSIQNGKFGNVFYSGSIRTYVLLFLHALYPMDRDILRSNFLKRKKSSNQPQHYGMYMKKSSVYLIWNPYWCNFHLPVEE
jgi:hypothetical protein